MGEAKEVAKYYNEYTKGYLKTYGDTIQAFRPSNTEDLHRYIMQSTGMKDGMRILDAGCGVCGPSSYFASHANVQIDAVTISDEQVKQAREAVNKAGLSDKITVHQGDFHHLEKLFEGQQYDLILFLESLGHSITSDKVIDGACQLLKDEGCVYIKDFFPLDMEEPELRHRQLRVIANINKYYEYNVLDLYKTIHAFRKRAMEIIYIRKMDFQDDIQARFDFEEMFEVDLFEELEEFRVAEWLELKFRKPAYPLFPRS
jgi:ubiquinone/menaquinone biosynthesis C-methylase UbiE